MSNPDRATLELSRVKNKAPATKCYLSGIYARYSFGNSFIVCDSDSIDFLSLSFVVGPSLVFRSFSDDIRVFSKFNHQVTMTVNGYEYHTLSNDVLKSYGFVTIVELT